MHTFEYFHHGHFEANAITSTDMAYHTGVMRMDKRGLSFQLAKMTPNADRPQNGSSRAF